MNKFTFLSSSLCIYCYSWCYLWWSSLGYPRDANNEFIRICRCTIPPVSKSRSAYVTHTFNCTQTHTYTFSIQSDKMFTLCPTFFRVPLPLQTRHALWMDAASTSWFPVGSELHGSGCPFAGLFLRQGHSLWWCVFLSCSSHLGVHLHWSENEHQSKNFFWSIRSLNMDKTFKLLRTIRKYLRFRISLSSM